MNPSLLVEFCLLKAEARKLVLFKFILLNLYETRPRLPCCDKWRKMLVS